MDLVQRYSKLYCGILYDAMHFDLKYTEPFVVHRDIKPAWTLFPQQKIFGPAFTCRGEKVRDEKDIDDTVRIKMFADFSPGCVQVIDTGRDDTVAHFGDISGKIARKFGAVGVVIDGYTRDIDFIRDDQFPLFCRGIQPVDAYGKWQIADYQTAISLTGAGGETIAVSPGDYIFGGADGVLVIPNRLAEDACVCAEKRLDKENKIRQELTERQDIQKMYDDIGRW